MTRPRPNGQEEHRPETAAADTLGYTKGDMAVSFLSVSAIADLPAP